MAVMPVGVSAKPTKPFDVNRLTDEQVEGDMDRNTRLDHLLGVSAPRRTKAWCGEVNAAMHSHIVAVPAQRLTQERLLLAPLSVAAAAERPTPCYARSTICPACGSGRPATRYPGS